MEGGGCLTYGHCLITIDRTPNPNNFFISLKIKTLVVRRENVDNLMLLPASCLILATVRSGCELVRVRKIMTICILIHSISSIVALVSGSTNLVQIKGTKIHKVLGWIFVVCMFISAISSFGIYNNTFSVIHILSLLVIMWILRAVYAIRFKPQNWLYIHASAIGAAYIAILIAGVGVFVRKIFLPGDSNAGYIASGFTAIICIFFLNKMKDKYKTSKSKITQSDFPL